MTVRREPPAKLCFGTFEVDMESHELRKRGMRIRIEEKPYQILLSLLERAGEVVTRRALRDRLWTGTFVGYDHGINTAVNKLRELLGDTARSPRFVETLPGIGYRFIAPVERSGASPSAAAKKMLVVLPFENMGGDPEQEYFAVGLTEEMISQLSQMNPKKLGVIARTSAMQYKGTKKSIGEIGRELNVEYVLEGSVRKSKRLVRITAQLIAASDQTHLWSGSYERELRDIFRVQEDVTQQISRALAFELLSSGQDANVQLDPEAHEAYLGGCFLSGQRSEGNLKKAILCFEQALSRDANYARAYSGMADCYSLLCWFGAFTPREAGARAAQAAKRAIETAPSLSAAHASMALVRFWFEWDWDGAEEEFLRALDANPNSAQTHQWYASFLNSMGRFEEAAAEQLRARELDPLSMMIGMSAADSRFFGRQYDHAIAQLRALLDHAPNFFPALFNLGRVLVQKGIYAEAITAFEKAVALSGNREGLPALAHAYALAGKTNEARTILDDLLSNVNGRYVASPMIARILLGLGEIDQCFEWLRKGIEERSTWIVFLKVDPVYDSVRNDPRFTELLRCTGLLGAARAATA